MALGLTQPLTEMSTRNLPGSKGHLAHKADNLTAICDLIVYKMWEPQPLTPCGPPWPVTVIALPLPYHFHTELSRYKLNHVGDMLCTLSPK
jgi:hypothetical protein